MLGFIPLKTNECPLLNQWLEDVFISYWNSPFLGDMLVFSGVFFLQILANDVFFFYGNLPWYKVKPDCDFEDSGVL